jgi:predicted RNase H-like HicB family nuclease
MRDSCVWTAVSQMITLLIGSIYENKLKERVCMEKFTAVYEQLDDWWIAFVEELPGANTQGETLDEVRENLKEAVQLIVEANRELARRQSMGKNVIREELVVAV